MRPPDVIRLDLARAYERGARIQRQYVADMREHEAEVERLEAELRGVEGLRPREHSSSVNRDMTGVHKVAISKGRSGDALAVAARKAGMTVTGLAKRVGVSKALLSMGRTGERSIKRDVCERIDALIGFAATAKNWPKITD